MVLPLSTVPVHRSLFLEGGIQMLVGQVTLAGLLGAEFNKYGNALPKSVAAGAVAVICVYVAAFAWSWCAASWPASNTHDTTASL